MEGGVIGPLGDTAILLHKGIIQAVQPLLLGADDVIRVILRLVLNELPHTVPQADQTFDAPQGGGGHLHRIHAAVFPVVDLSVHDSIGEVAHGGVCRDGAILLQFIPFLTLILLDGAANVADGGSQQIGEFLALEGDTGRLRPIGAADLLHITQNHFRVVNEILVHLEAAFIDTKMHPVGFNIYERISLLQEQNIGRDLRAGSALEGVIGQADGTQQVGPLSDVFAHRRVFLVQGAFAGDKGHDTTGAYFVQGLAKEVVVDQEVMLVIAPVGHLEVAKGDVADGHIEEAVRQVGLFVALDGHRGGLVELLGNPSADLVQFNGIAPGAGHTLRHHAQEVAGAAGWLQHVSCLKSHLLQGLIHGTNDHRGRVEGGQGGFSRCLVLIRGK